MNKLFLVLALSLGSATLSHYGMMHRYGASEGMGSGVIDKLIKFEQMEKRHKNDWFNFKEMTTMEKFNLLKEQHNDKYDMHIKMLHHLKHRGLSTQMLQHKLHHKIELCKHHMEQWKELCMNQAKIGIEIYKKHKSELEHFERMLGHTYEMEQPEEMAFVMPYSFQG